nr:NYN domain-containing protein [uncultured Campylobacter sp.]
MEDIEFQNFIKLMYAQISDTVNKTTSRVAVLIDGDNIRGGIKYILNKAGELGEVIIKRVYCDFATDTNKKWKSISHEFALNMIQTPEYSGKNTNDIMLTIDAMKMLFNNLSDVFCIVTNDKDFVPLIISLREHNKKVYTFGGNNASEELKKASNDFFEIESSDTPLEIPKDLLEQIKQKCKEIYTQNDNKMISCASLNSQIKEIFKYKDFNYKKFSDFIKQYSDLFECEKRDSDIYVRLKNFK